MHKDKAESLYETIEYFSGYGFNKSHAVSYAIDSYYSAWLHTHYEKEWLATCLGAVDWNPKKLAKVMGEIKQLGYKILDVDVNTSDTVWSFIEKQNGFVPPLSSMKGVGGAAVDEILANRPYTDLSNLLFDDEGKWRHSKMNKRCFDSLCKVEAFGSLDEIKSGDISNHRQMLAILTEEDHYEKLRKSEYGLTKTQIARMRKKGNEPDSLLDNLISDYKMLPDWSRTEKISHYMDLTSSVNVDLVFPEQMMERVAKKNIESLFDIEAGTRGVGWFCVTDIISKVTKNGKPFFRFKVMDNNSNTAWLRVWGQFKFVPELYTIWVADAHNDPNWGMSTSVYKMKQVTAYD